MTGQTSKRIRLNDSADEITTLIDPEAISDVIMRKMTEALKDTFTKSPTEKHTNPDTGKILNTVLPAIITTVVSAVTECLNKFIEAIDKREETNRETSHDVNLSAQMRTLTYENDRLQQYSRRENIRIHRVEEDQGETGETTEKKALAVLRATGVTVDDQDIAACHRVGKPRGGPKAIIVRFVSRRKRTQIMKNKKKLKEQSGMKRTFINDDLTTLRSRLYGYVRALPCVDKAWTVDGKVFALKKSPPGSNPTDQRPYIIETPDDLFRIGEDKIDYAKLGLKNIAFDEQ